MSFLSTKVRQSVLAASEDQEIVTFVATIKEKSVNEVIRECDIHLTTAYRKINWLLDKGLGMSCRH
ncbi:MAG: hypothetical protein WBP64_12960 [Nitrososphaeraceae archaeon]